MLSKSLMVSIAEQKCPKCRKGDMFIGHPYNLKTFDKMYKNCSNCNAIFELEPGFFMGAMYVSYAIQLIMFLSIFVITQLLYPEAGVLWYLSWIVGMILLLFPLIFRLSRTIWLHIFVPFNAPPKKAQTIL